jgi:hypothetical protein
VYDRYEFSRNRRPPVATEKRDIKRHKKRLTIRFGIEEVNRVAFSDDISTTGMFIKTMNICPPDTRIRVEFEIGHNKVELEARVMWAKKVPQNLFYLVKKSGMGVRIVRFFNGEEHFNNFIGSSAD